jgi:phosphatidylserine/phosphatidylglycerophosphate/cardiolipin synthase-like enzyme
MRTALRYLKNLCVTATYLGAAVSFGSTPAAAQERLYFPVRDNVKNVIVQRINAETVRVDVATWYLTQREISLALVNKAKAGVPVRVIGDRVSIFEIDQYTRREFEYLANAGIPIRLRYNPTSFPSIMHWKCGIFAGQGVQGQGVVEFGSANWTPFELYPSSATNYKDETVLVTDDPDLVKAFKARFDQFWANTTEFLDWPVAYQRETGQIWTGTVPMTIDRTRLEPDYQGPSSMVWEQGTVLNNRMVTEINSETQGVDIVVYRLTVPTITNALIGRVNAGVPVRVLVEPTQYHQADWPEYWLTGARIDQLWVAGAQIKERVHAGLTHMKVLITSASALSGSSNFSKNWQRDHNYFIPAAEKPLLYGALRGEFNRIWGDTVNYRDFQPKPPKIATLVAPASAATGQSLRPTFQWSRATWAVSYDVLLGTTSSNLVKQGTVNAVLTETPPATYSWTPPPSFQLQPNTIYYWKVVSRTFASLTATSASRYFKTAASSGGGSSTPFGGTPVALPGTIQSENFDEGGQNVAYFDSTTGNTGGACRTNTDVDITTTTDTGGGCALGWAGAGEWLKYTVNVGTAGTYDIEARVASGGAGGTFHIEVGGVDKTGPIIVPNTGGGQTWATVRKTGVSLTTTGQQVWRVVMDSNGASTGAVGNINFIRVVSSSAPPPPPPPSEIVIYAADVPAANVHGNWALTNDGTAAAGRKLASANLGASQLNAPLAVPADYVDVTFTAQAGVRYKLWLRTSALNADKYNDAVWVQFTGSVNSSGTAIYRIGTSQGLLVNMATCSTCVPSGWGWQNKAYWLSDTGEVRFATSGQQTLRIQIREDGVAVDQIVLSPQRYLSAAPGPTTNDTTIVPKP